MMNASTRSLGFAIVLLLASSGPALGAERRLDHARSEIAFTVEQMGVPVEGRFARFDADLAFDPAEPARGQVEVRVDTGSIRTGTPEADSLAVDTPWLHAAAFPQARFRSEAIRPLGGTRYEVSGTLQIRDVRRPLTLPVELQARDDGTLLATGSFDLERSDFGVGGGEWNDADLVANTVPVRFRLMLVPASP